MIKKSKIVTVVILAIITMSLTIVAIPKLFPIQGSTAEQLSPIQEPTTEMHTQITRNTTDHYRKSILQLGIEISQHPPSNKDFIYDFNITQGETIVLKITLSSLSNQTEFTIPVSLSVWAFEEQNLPNRIEIPLSPFPVLPKLNQEYNQDSAKLFAASFDLNPVILAPKESKTIDLTITALENTSPGVYTIDLQTGNTEQTGLGGIVFRLNVLHA